ncbi:hypothetical protein Rhopal_002339-T1 [Rhodotorula paludigena]|uniref:CFA20 domain-containing protein n=1 Tax=Rhodotorula paludigena TaxID=86838 RepID=A0AAV5GJH4_9BASI|nr:hypothetical protein Rhopal_002339-T1 [Rhodotorula paludigena]
MLLQQVVQPSLISLFSSTSSHPTLLASCKADAATASDSFISLLDDATDSSESLIAWHASLGKLRGHCPPDVKDLRGQVLHLQAPDSRTTSVRWGSLSGETWRRDGLGIELPVVHLQLKHLGAMYFEVGVVNKQGELTVVRCSTWQAQVKLHPPTPSHPRLLHLPLLFPSSTSTVPLLTSWCTISLPLQTLLISLSPPLQFHAVTGVEVHATCRLRRVFFTDEDTPGEVDEGLLRRGVRPELAMFAAGDH